MSMRVNRSLWAMLLLAALPAAAGAQDLSPAERRAGASAAYNRGTEAYRGGDYDAAARWYETADELAPSANALIQAIRAHERAGSELRAASLAVALVERYGEERMASHTRIIERVAGRALRLTVRCDGCRIEIDGDPERLTTLFLTPDTEHVVVARFDAGVREERVAGPPGESRTLEIEPPAPEPIAPVTPGPEPTPVTPPIGTGDGDGDDDRGISPWFFASAATLTVAAGAVLLWSGLDTLDARDRYEEMPTQERYDRGRELERRTNILIGVTAGLAAATVGLVFGTDWDGDEEPAPSPSVALLPRGGAVVLSGRLR
jgi:hypothetical protein